MKKRPPVLEGKTIKITSSCGALYMTINYHNGKPYEMRFSLGKSGTCQNIQFFHLGVMLSILLQEGIEKDKIIKTLKKHFLGVICGEPFFESGEKYTSCFDAIARKIINEIEEKEEEVKK